MITTYFPLAGKAYPVRTPETPDELHEFADWWSRECTRGPIALDTETTGLDIFSRGYRLRTVQFGTEREAWVIPFELGGPFVTHVTQALWDIPAFTIHNASFDWLVLDRCAAAPLEMLWPKTTDTRILAALIDPRQPQEGGIGTGLKPLSDHYIATDAPDTAAGLYAEFRKIGKTKETGWAAIDLWNRLYLTYAGGDVILTAQVRTHLEYLHRLRGIRPALIPYEHEIAFICAYMQRKGIVLDREYVIALDARLSEQNELNSAIAATFGVANINSTDQIAAALLKRGVELTERTASGKLKVDKAVLTQLAGMTLQGAPIEGAHVDPLALAVYRAKRAAKWKSAYADTFLETVDESGRIHPMINPLQARTGRMSITRPALQTLPSGDWTIRRALLADEGHVIVSVDFAAVELRVLAALANVRLMKEAISAGRDLHGFTAELVYGPGFTDKQRKICKGIGFGKVYGGGLATIVAQTGAAESDVAYALRRYDMAYPEVKRASQRWQREARQAGMYTTTLTGRQLPLDADRAYAVVNYQCQSVARDCLGQSMINMREAGLLDYLRLLVHDETLASVPAADAEELMREITRCMTLDLGGVPIDADGEIGGRSWGSLYGASL
jgi:DNA polymerase-1